MNIQGVQRANFHIRNSFSPLCKLADTVLFPHDDSNVTRFWTEQTATSASPKCGSGSDAVLHSVTVEEAPIPFSPFSSVDCTMLNHFSFNDFIAIAFPDIVGDLDAQI